MNILKGSISFLCFFCISTDVVLADTTKEEVYLGFQFGYGQFKFDKDGSLNKEDENLIGGINLGYRYSNYFATEINYQHLGEGEFYSQDKSVHLNVDQVALLGKVIYPITQELEPYLKFGVSRWFGKENGYDVDGFSPVFGGGIQYTIEPALQLGISYQYIDSIAMNDDAGHSGVIFDINYRFGSSKPAGNKNSVMPYDEPKEKIEVLEPSMVDIPTLSISFSFDSIKINETESLRNYAEQLRKDDTLVARIYGYASPVGNKRYNEVLSQQRADAVRAYFINYGIEPKRLFSQGNGEYNSKHQSISFGQRADVLLCVEKSSRDNKEI
ncbi:outer membrane beta-barrel protein [Vibrio rhodolitus]|uniref:outer membrane beta-barrel protein n=1 Tax=Vibrio rhodolitus TaxID=2231649 RepID=UPI000E0B3E88|nr:outer membrane beta-barrel protein [Vibrio rhodolitus]